MLLELLIYKVHLKGDFFWLVIIPIYGKTLKKKKA